MAIFDSDGRCQDLDLIGRGGMAEVHRVRDRRINRPLAMKVLAWDLADTTAARICWAVAAAAALAWAGPSEMYCDEGALCNCLEGCSCFAPSCP